MKISIYPDPKKAIKLTGGVNSVVADHAAGFLLRGIEIVHPKRADVRVGHALSQGQIDVFHCHGLYPIGDGYFSAGFNRANEIVIDNALRATRVICVSQFGADILRHQLHIDPLVIRNGIWIDQYKKGGDKSGPVLFPKLSLDANAKADDVIWLRDNANLNLASIAPIPGIRSTGKLTRDNFISLLSGCSIYLGVTRENNSMATMESMIMGVPVAGYQQGFNAEWLTNGIGCELVIPGDKLGLKLAIQKIQADWQRYSKAAREYSRIFDWNPVIDELVTIYSTATKLKEKTISIIIPCHNYGKYLDQAIQSALDQTIKCEIIVADDLSSDNSVKIAQKYPVKLIKNAVNLGVAETRNKGISAASGEFILCLDADDVIKPSFIAETIKHFTDEKIAGVFTPVELMDETGNLKNITWFKTDPSRQAQQQGKNQVPSCCLFRRSFWQRAGGYKCEYTPAEDARLWLDMMNLGGDFIRVGNTPLMQYRVHDNQISRAGFPNWWTDATEKFNQVVVNRAQSDILLIITNSDERIGKTLECLEKQTYKRWSAIVQDQPELKIPAFPWLNRNAGEQNPQSIIKIKSGELLKPSYLENYKSQSPPWMNPK